MKIKGLFISSVGLIALACSPPNSTTNSGTAGTAAPTLVGGSTTSSGGSSTTTSTSSTTSTVNAIQIITKADPTGSFDPAAVPLAGGASIKATRIYNLDGSLITTGNIPTWYSEARVFLTSTRTAAGAPSYNGTDTPCAYFDSYSTDINPESSGYYTIDGYTPSLNAGVDIDQCAGTAASELNQLGMYVKIDRRFSITDKYQVIVKVKPLGDPNIAPTPSSCVVGGFFDGSACSNTYFTLSMRTAPAAPTKPFYILFPSAKTLDLLSEAVLVPTQIDTSITTISIDRVKGGAVFYGMTLIRLP